MASLNYSAVHFEIAPRSYGNQTQLSGGNTYDVYGLPSETILKSVNSDIILQVIWLNNSPNIYQYQEGTGTNGERIEGDLVNVLFDIYEGTTAINQTGNLGND